VKWQFWCTVESRTIFDYVVLSGIEGVGVNWHTPVL
jgi:hypothetical protein